MPWRAAPGVSHTFVNALRSIGIFGGLISFSSGFLVALVPWFLSFPFSESALSFGLLSFLFFLSSFG